MSRILQAGSLLVVVIAMALAFTAAASAQQAKLIESWNLSPGQQVAAHATPPTFGIDVYWFGTTEDQASGFYRCRIVSNTTGRTLTLRMLDLSGAVIGTCIAATGTSCNTPIRSLVGDNQYTCLVASSSSQLASSPHYVIAVRRCSSATTC